MRLRPRHPHWLGAAEQLMGVSQYKSIYTWSASSTCIGRIRLLLTGRFLSGFSLSQLISRAPPKNATMANSQYDDRHTSTFKVVGRHVLNLWRIMRSELNLRMYTFENVAYKLLRRRYVSHDMPSYPPDIHCSPQRPSLHIVYVNRVVHE